MNTTQKVIKLAYHRNDALWIEGFNAAKAARNAEADARLSNASLTGACL